MKYKCIKFTNKIKFNRQPTFKCMGPFNDELATPVQIIESELISLYIWKFRDLNQAILDEIRLLAAKFEPKDGYFYSFELSDGKGLEFVLSSNNFHDFVNYSV